jgi:WD40 repeat protein
MKRRSWLLAGAVVTGVVGLACFALFQWRVTPIPTVFGNIQGKFDHKDLNAPKRSVLASVPRPGGDFLAYSPDGNVIATATRNGPNQHGPVQLTWLTLNGPVHTLLGTEGPLPKVAFSPDSTRVATRLGDKMPLTIWDVASGRQLISMLGGTTDLTWSPDGKSLAYPLKLVGLYVQTHRQSLDLTQMKSVKGNIRLKDVSVIGDGK